MFNTKRLSAQVEQLSKELADTKKLTQELYALMGARTGRPYWPLADGRGLAHLNSGEPFFVSTRDTTVTPWILMGGHWETNVEQVLLSYVQPGMRCADIGAHMGYYTVKLGKRIGYTGKLLSFEPNPLMNELVYENIKINGLLFSTDLRRHALGDKPGRGRLSYSGGNLAQATLQDDPAAQISVEVEVHTLDAVNDAPLDLVKLDAEGYEPQILAGAKTSIAANPNCALMMELSIYRWEQSLPIGELEALVGATKRPFAVTAQGMLQAVPYADVPAFLRACMFGENYFFFCPNTEAALSRIAPLLG